MSDELVVANVPVIVMVVLLHKLPGFLRWQRDAKLSKARSEFVEVQMPVLVKVAVWEVRSQRLRQDELVSEYAVTLTAS